MTDSPQLLVVPAWHRSLFVVAAVMVVVLVMSGGVVCITDASRGCPDWPECHGRWIPPAQMDSIIEWSHRLLTPLALPWVVAAAVVAWRRYRSVRWILVPTLASIACILAVVGFGAAVILTGLSRFWATVDLGTALLAVATMVTAATVVALRFRTPMAAPCPSWRTPFARLAAATAGVVYAVLVSCVPTARPGAVSRCLNWPGLAGVGAPDDLFAWLQLGRLAAGWVATALIVALVVTAWRSERSQPLELWGATAAAVLVVAGTVVGALMPLPDQGVLMPLASLKIAAMLWAVLVMVAVAAGLRAR